MEKPRNGDSFRRAEKKEERQRKKESEREAEGNEICESWKKTRFSLEGRKEQSRKRIRENGEENGAAGGKALGRWKMQEKRSRKA